MTEKILRLIDELDTLGKTREDAWQISREEGELLEQIAIAANARVVIEVGTSFGFSTLFWGSAMLRTGGVVHTIDLDPKKFESSKSTFAAAELDAVVVNHLGNATEVLAGLNGPFDLAFIDSDKSLSRQFFDLIWPKLRPGGSIITDNATTHKGELSEFIKYVRALPDSASVEVPVGNGIEWTLKVAKP